MTALDRYVRLEAVGLWREDPDQPAREVIVSFGNATLVLKDLAEKPLGHWALAGMTVLRHEGPATVYAMTPDGGETLTIKDADMVAAIAAVARPAVPRTARRRRRLPVGPLLFVAALVALAAAAPRLIRAEADRLVPPEQAAEIGDRMLIALIERHGPLCAEPEGSEVLARLAAAIDPADPPRLRVLELGDAPAAVLPGRNVLLDRGVAASPEIAAGWAAQALTLDPVAELLARAGPLADLRYLLTGRFDEATLVRAALAAPLPPGPPPPSPAGLEIGDRDRVALEGICG